MKNQKTPIIIAVVVVLLLLLAIPTCSSYNGMVTKSEEADQAWGEVQNQYQRRFDLIPNLVATVKGYAAHEQNTLQGVTNARVGMPSDSAMMAAYNEAMASRSTDPANARYAQAQQELQRQMSIYVNAVHEAYPDLKASKNFEDLQYELSGTENRVEKARHDYTEAVKDYNLKVKRFPGSIVASLFGFDAKPQFEAEQQAQSAPKVEF
ncbi:MAG: LemA family protein [Paramuribaculum sp.]|nr:LemA family protein [Paramuribaculum sp.]MDE6782616.1 LemA family protein [Paramuribaculum sp.]